MAWVTVVGTVLVWLFGGKPRTALRFIVGYDNRISTSKAQYAMWTVPLAFAFLFFTAQIGQHTPVADLENSLATFGPEHLLLLGFPVAAAVAAQAVTSAKVAVGDTRVRVTVPPGLIDTAAALMDVSVPTVAGVHTAAYGGLSVEGTVISRVQVDGDEVTIRRYAEVTCSTSTAKGTSS